MIAFDTETHLIQPGLLAPPLVCGSFANEHTEWIANRADTLRKLRFYLTNGEELVGANIAYDMAVVAAADPTLLPLIFQAYQEGRIHDVQIRTALDAIAGGHLHQDPRSWGPLKDPESGKQMERYSLAICCDIILGRKIAKADTWRLRYGELDGIEIRSWPREAIEYPLADARNTWDVWAAQQGVPYKRQEGDAPGWQAMPQPFRNLHNEAAQCRAAFALHLACVWGIRTDGERVLELETKVTAEHERALRMFTEAGIFRSGINPETGRPWPASKMGTKDTERLKALVTAAYKGTPPVTDKGAVKCDRDTLSESGMELLEKLAESGENEKIYTTYLDLLRKGVHAPINPSANVLVSSGRASMYRPNLQQLPRSGGVRECFRARPGWVFCSVDYSTLELRTLAQVNLWMHGWSDMAEALKRGEDLHTALAANLVGLPYSEMMARVKAKDKDAKNKRQLAKVGNFGFPGGMGVAKLVWSARKAGDRLCLLAGRGWPCPPCEGIAGNDPGCPRCDGSGMICGLTKVTEYRGRPCPPACTRCLDVGQELRDGWFSKWREMKDYFEKISTLTSGPEDVGDLVQAVTKRVRGRCGFCDGANTLFQGLAADGAKDAFWELTRECYLDSRSALYGARPQIFIHDEAILEIPEERASAAGDRQAQVMREVMARYVPDVPIEAEPALMRYLYKGAEAVRDAQGRLLVWEPAPVDKQAA